MTEREKMISGELYDPTNKELEQFLIVCEIHIGDNVMIGPNVTLATPMHPFLPEERNSRKREDGSFYNLEQAKPITIKDNCWLASNVVVCGGVTIGEGCVIGAGSVVTRDIPPYSLAAGNPCRVIRQGFLYIPIE